MWRPPGWQRPLRTASSFPIAAADTAPAGGAACRPAARALRGLRRRRDDRTRRGLHGQDPAQASPRLRRPRPAGAELGRGTASRNPEDVAAYELRMARQFGRLVYTRGGRAGGHARSCQSLPADLERIAGLNAFFLPEPPRHRGPRSASSRGRNRGYSAASLVVTVNARTVFAVPRYVGDVDGRPRDTSSSAGENSRRTGRAAKPPELCKVDPRRGWTWVASSQLRRYLRP